ncbi:hypothetical protein JXA85_00360 [Candidatus Woesearchaeota archaeon]|nr:hypothetical protein [Candidatus Woesearchaeota archaeon]
MSEEKNDKMWLPLISIVAVVAIVGIVVMTAGKSSTVVMRASDNAQPKLGYQTLNSAEGELVEDEANLGGEAFRAALPVPRGGCTYYYDNNDPYITGYVMDENGVKHWDQCEDQHKLVDYYCEGDAVMSDMVTCDYCSNGACETCREYTNQDPSVKEYYVATIGKSTGGKRIEKSTDFCSISDGSLIQVFCQDGPNVGSVRAYIRTDCNCFDGTCK